MLSENGYACLHCRSSKRRCDRQRPQCSLCSKKGLDCSYTSQQPEKVIEQAISEPVAHRHQRSRALSVLTTSFLDFDFFKASQLVPQPLAQPLNVDAAKHLDSGPGVHDIAAVFFDTVHPWMPIFSRRLFYQHLLNPFAGRTTDFYLVLLSMKLVAMESPSSDSGLHVALKNSLIDVVDRGHLTLYALQASILLVVFEIGHAIYPAAYFSVGFCTRLATALGVDKTIYAHEGPWADIEEARRSWWAILIMDRIIALGSHGRAIVTPSPELSSILPCDDQSWDEEGPSVHLKPSFQLGVASTLQLGRFGRLAQSTRLLDQTINLVASTTTSDACKSGQAAQLRRTIMALCHLYQLEQDKRRLEYCSQSAVLFSAVFLLSKSEYCEPGTTSLSYFPETRDAIASIQDMLPRVMAANAEPLSLFLPHAIYKCALAQVRYERLPPVIEEPDLFEDLKAALQHLSHRWHSAVAYLEMVHAVEETIPT